MIEQSDADGFVRLDHLVKQFPGAPSQPNVLAVDDVSLSVARGEFVALLGPSGCGKTTLLRILAGQEEPTSGEVWIDGVSLAGVPPERRPVNMVFQSPALFPHMTVAENIGFGPSVARIPPAEIRQLTDDMLSLVRLSGYGERRVTQLSGGQAQRVSLARALVNHPKVLLLDEPLSALDLNLRQQMQLELRAIHRRLGTTFIYVTHDQEEAVVMADRIVLMNAGVVLQEGTPRDIYANPRSLFASQFVGHNNVLAGIVQDSQRPDVVEVAIGGLTVSGLAEEVLPPGSDVWVVIRPERIDLSRTEASPAAQGYNQAKGEVVDVAYLGPTTRYDVTTQLGQPMVVIVAASNEDRDLSIGSAVVVTWSASSARILRR